MATIVAIYRDDVDLPLATLQSVLYRFGERARTEVVVRCLSSDFASPICKMIQPIFGGSTKLLGRIKNNSIRNVWRETINDQGNLGGIVKVDSHFLV